MSAHEADQAARQGERRRRIFLWTFGIVMVLTAGTGFAFKLIEFIYVATRDGADALTSFLIPVLTYLVVAAGFFCLFLWAYARGEFHDVEKVKYRMLQMQAIIDRDEAMARARREGRRSRHV